MLSSARISAQSLGMVCITAAVDINPNVLKSLESIVPFLESQDPKLRSSVSKVRMNECIDPSFNLLGSRYIIKYETSCYRRL